MKGFQVLVYGKTSLTFLFSLFNLSPDFPIPPSVLGEIAKFEKNNCYTTVGQSVCPSVCFTVQNNSVPTGRIFINFQI